ncbi:MAG: hypothetical protein CM15mP116_09940 [Synechococcus sp.]|nr:MAG: hypothetical protein CM15mP116_09940 [Synechococcus sp.]
MSPSHGLGLVLQSRRSGSQPQPNEHEPRNPSERSRLIAVIGELTAISSSVVLAGGPERLSERRRFSRIL